MSRPLPILRPLESPKASKRFELKLHTVKPEDIIPNGDRYVVEVIDIDETVELGQLLAVYVDPNINPKDPMAPPQVEQRGVIVGIVLSAGDGHLLGLPDWAVQTQASVVRIPADVPMKYATGDVVFIDRNAKGRALRIVGRELRVCNQIDVLCSLKGVRMVRDDSGEWRQSDSEVG